MMMVDRSAVLTRLAQLAAAGDPQEQWVTRLCEASRQLVSGRGSSVSLYSDENTRLLLTATDDIAAQFENLHDILADGPGRQAYRDNVAFSADLRPGSGRRWPEFIRTARETADDVTLHCFPMRPISTPMGVFSVYARAGELTESPAVLQFLADAIGAAVLNDSDLLDADGAWAARAVVHQATGMLIAQLRVGPEDAMAILRAHAFADNATVEMIAEQIVQRRLDLREDT
ncbi:ANTAR domain-containing protein [Kribbella sp. NPDC056951]|uniref:ANTAR domain-containing protein n=1 Tax=Kribbella sp. NPDC056951 TaxID=3345978 RepID=UPI0036338590